MRKFLSLIFVLILSVAGWLYYFLDTPLAQPKQAQDLVLKHGTSLRGISQQLVSEGILNEPWSFMTLVRLSGKSTEIQAGNYQIQPNMTPRALIRMLTNGDTKQSGVVFIEGWNFKQFRDALNRNESVKHAGMVLTSTDLLKSIGASESQPEGLFSPDSYFFSEGMTDIEILHRAYVTMQKKLADAWANRAPDLPYQTSYQALIMASIVEKETGRGNERPLIARVFLNRMKIGMRLQTDPTVIYGLGDSFDGNLRKRDLLTDTPYNTYTRAGLPPTPIAMPGMASIEAALHPADSQALYFVGKGDGSHVFSNSLEEHNRAVFKYQLKRK